MTDHEQDLTKSTKSTSTSEVMGPDAENSSDPSVLKSTRENIRRILAERDDGLVAVWDELSDFQDTNRLILFNMQQTQTHIQQTQEEFYGMQRRHSSILEQIIEKGEEHFHEYNMRKQEFDKDEREMRKHIMDMMKNVTALAKEYRQCAMQKTSYYHKTLVMEFFLALRSAVMSHVHDEKTLSAISRQMAETCQSLFPTSAEADFGA